MMQQFRKLWQYHGGLRLPGHKGLSNSLPVAVSPVPPVLVLPLQQHIGQPAQCVVQIGESVLKGQMLAKPQGYVSAAVHAPTSGVIKDIGLYPIPHPSGLYAPCIVLESDGNDRWIERRPVGEAYRQMKADELRRVITDAGVVGLGGATFPSAVKLNPGQAHAIETLVINGVECEPYITCDDMLMREHAADVISGARIIQHIVGARQCLIAVEDNKPQAIAMLQQAVADANFTSCEVVSIPTIYPSGGEKQLIKVLTGREVPSQGLPAEIGVICHNVGTSVAVHDAVIKGEPLISRIVTITGEAVKQPRNVRVLLGTPMKELIAYCGGYTYEIDHLVMGGPMMGLTLSTDDLPVIKSTNCLLTIPKSQQPEAKNIMPCIRCGQCASVCPVELLPQQLYWYASSKNFDKIQDHQLFDCIECGCCSYVCPSHIPLVQYFRYAKNEIRAQEKNKQQADHARQRHEARQQRLEQEKREKEERLRLKQEMLARKQQEQTKGGEGDDSRKAEIEAAMARVKAKKTAQGEVPDQTDASAATQRAGGREGI